MPRALAVRRVVSSRSCLPAAGLLLLLGGLAAFTGSAIAATPPVVTAVSPTSGLTTGDTIVTVTGTGFTGATAVDFGSVPAPFTVNSDTSITATSPGESPGTVNITVVTPNGLSLTSAADQFTYLAAPAPPTVTAVSPDSGLTTGGATVAITGTGFTGATAVDFGSVPATFTVGSDTSIAATSPAESAGTVDVTVSTPDGLSAMSAADQFTYVASGPGPTVTGVSPTSGPASGGTSVAISGSGFTGASAVDFGSTPATFIVTSDTAIAATSPSASVGKVDVTVTTPNGMSATSSADQFTYLVSPPAVTGVSPTSGSTAGGTTVVITGTNLKGATAVTFGSVAAASFTVHSAVSISAKTPPEAVGIVDVTVTTPEGMSATSPADQFTFGIPPPVVTGISPTSGPSTGGTSVTISGNALTGTTAVDFGTASALFLVNSDSSITAVAPAESVGKVDVTVTTPGGTSATTRADKFTFTAPPPAPVVKHVTPRSGSVTGGTAVTITGRGFTGATVVDFGTVPASFTVTSDTSITATSPPESVGSVDITVTTPNGTTATSAADQFGFKTPLPGVTAISPTSGSALGGTEVTITGVNFTGAFAVHFGSVAATIVVTSNTSITATAPAEQIRTVPVTVTTLYGTSAAKSADRFTFTTPLPAVTDVSPDSGSTAGGTIVKITGTYLDGATAVDFGALPATTFTINSNTSITATSPAEPRGKVDITVTTPVGVSSTGSADRFTFSTRSGVLHQRLRRDPKRRSDTVIDGQRAVGSNVEGRITSLGGPADGPQKGPDRQTGKHPN